MNTGSGRSRCIWRFKPISVIHRQNTTVFPAKIRAECHAQCGTLPCIFMLHRPFSAEIFIPASRVGECRYPLIFRPNAAHGKPRQTPQRKRVKLHRFSLTEDSDPKIIRSIYQPARDRGHLRSSIHSSRPTPWHADTAANRHIASRLPASQRRSLCSISCCHGLISAISLPAW